jgi:uncharacterized protein
MSGHLVVSIHDVSPRHEKLIDRWRSILDGWGVEKRSFAVVPHYDGDGRTADCPSLIGSLREEAARGSELVLHGFSHVFQGSYDRFRDRARDLLTTRGCAEFSAVDAATARELIARGIGDLEPVLGCKFKGFTAPGWWQGPSVAAELRKAGFLFYTLTFGIVDLVRDKFLKSPVVVGLPGQGVVSSRLLRAFSFRLVPFWMRNRPLVRVALHPYDLDNALFMREVESLLKREMETRKVSVYEDLIQ